MNTTKKKRLAPLAALLVAGVVVADTVKIDPAIPGYNRTSGVSGSLSSIGSDTLNNLMTYWAEGYKKAYPNVNISIEGKGSSTAPPALIEGTSQLGPMSREMTSAEVDKFEAKYKHKPTRIRVALDGLPFDQKTAIVLREIDGLSYEEIGFSLGIAVGTVKSRLARAREGLRAQLRDV